MSILREKPYAGCNFTVDLGTGEVDSPEAGLFEVVLPEARFVTVEYRQGNEKTNEPTKLTTTMQYGTLILRRGVIGSLNWYQWWNMFRNGDQSNLRTIVVRLHNEDRTNTVLTWKFIRARPVNYLFSPLNALGGELFTESLEIAFDRMEME